MDKTKWLLVGPGDIARKRVAPAIVAVENSELCGVVYRTRKEEAHALARQFGAAEIYSDFETALKETSANAVYLATPVRMHVPHAIRALESGKHVLVEKPLGLNGDEAHLAAGAAEKTDLRAGCSYYRRLFPRFQHAMRMLERGELGKIVSVRMIYHAWFQPSEDDPKRWRVIREESGGGPLFDMGSHMFDILVGLFGNPKNVFAKSANLIHSWEVEDSATAIMELPEGAHATASFHWNSKSWKHEFEIVGTEARVKWLPFDSGPVVITRDPTSEEFDLPNPENVHTPLIKDFVGAILGSHDPICPFAEAAKTNRLLDAVYLSARKGTEVFL